MSTPPAGDHIIFKVCINCAFDTLQYPDRPRHRGPSCRCPECGVYSFVIACSECLFENSAECPLTQLLNRKHDVHEGEIEDEGPRGRPWECSWEKEDEAANESEGFHQVSESSNEEELSTEQQWPVNCTDSRAAPNQPGNLGDPEASICPQCCQQQCRTCKPGYMNLIVDMKEFSMTFAEEMRLCTLCEHQLCPSSALVVMLQCRECAHKKCPGCSQTVDTLGEDWCMCCRCEKRLQGLAAGFAASDEDEMCQEQIVEDSKSFMGSQARKDSDEKPQAGSANTQGASEKQDTVSYIIGEDRGFPAWLVGEDGSEAPASRMRRAHKRVRWSD
jgi:hypothetical protein